MRLHASCVAFEGKGLILIGASGSGKSALALQMMAHGARLVSDDQTLLTLQNGWPAASAPDPIRGVIEARGIGLLAADPEPSVRIALAVDMDRTETERLPPDRTLPLMNCAVPLFHKQESPYFAAALLQYMKAGKARV